MFVPLLRWPPRILRIPRHVALDAIDRVGDPRATRLTPAAFHILLALADDDRHGLGIMREVERRTDGDVKLGPGILYGSIKKLLAAGLVDAVSIPVVAARGIMDGRGLAAALSLGTGAAQLGTRFLLTKESGAYPEYRAWIATRDPAGTRVTRWMTGRPARSFGSRLLERLETSGLEPLPWPYPAVAAENIYRASHERGLAGTTLLLAGQGPRTDVRELGAAELVMELVGEAAAVLEGLVPGVAPRA